METRNSGTIRGSALPNLVGLSEAQVRSIRESHSIDKLHDIATLEKEDFDEVFGTENSTFLLRKRLHQTAQFLRKGGTITGNTTMMDVLTYIHAPNPPTATVARSVMGSSPIKLSPSDVPKFTGNIRDQDKYRTQIEAIVGQTAFKFILNRDPTTAEEKERDEELFNVFKASFHDGTAYHLITSSLTNDDGTENRPSGRRVWESFKTWCNSGGRKDALRKKLEDELEDLKLDGDVVDGFEYVNTFITKHSELKRIGVNKPVNNIMRKYIDNIEDKDFDVVQQHLEGLLLTADREGKDVEVQEFYDRVETRQRALSKQADKDMDIKSRRQQMKRGRVQDKYQSGYSSGDSSASKAQDEQLLTLPSALFSTLDRNQKHCFNKWRRSVKEGGKIDERVFEQIMSNKPGKPSSKDRAKSSSKSKSSKKSKVSRMTKIRRTDVQISKTTSEDVRLFMKSDEEDDYNDEEISSPTTNNQGNDRKVAATKIIRKSTPEQHAKDMDFKFQTILDSGTEWTVVGGPAWSISQIHSRSLNIAAVDSQMPTVKTSLCDAVTAVLSENGQTTLIGVRKCGYSPSLNDDEAVINSHFLREAGWNVDCVSKRHGGKQSLSIGEVKIPLEYNATCYKMFYRCRAPTQIEMKSLQINWIDCHDEDLDIDDGRKPVRRKQRDSTVALILPNSEIIDPAMKSVDSDSERTKAPFKSPLPGTSPAASSPVLENEETTVTARNLEEEHINWKLTLGHCNDDVVVNTLKHTTQYFAQPVEAEVRAYPRQHRQKRLMPLHLKRIQGRTAGDTFFSSIRSVRGYTCVQLFVALAFDFIYVKCLRRESQVPGAYQDFCREVGAPNELLTDNSKVQSGEKFKKINRENMTKHNFSTPHCQNQNPSERRIQDVKHRAILVLFASKAPLTFWCYAVEFVVNCLNHTSKRKLDGRTSIEGLTGNTPDISMFRFEFWQPIEYLDPNVKFPDCKWKHGRFVGIAWKHGDPLTYRIWTEPESGGWQKGKELVRNVVRSRNKSSDEIATKACSKSELDEFVLVPGRERQTLDVIIKKRKQQQRKRGRTQEGRSSGTKRSKKNPTKDSPIVPLIAGDNSEGNIGSTIKTVRFADELEADITFDTTSGQEPFYDLPATVHDGGDDIPSLNDLQPTNIDMEAINEVNNELDPHKSEDQSQLIAFNGQRWKNGGLQLRALYSSDDTQWLDFKDVKEDFPRKTATYIVAHYKTRSRKEGRDRVLSWAKKVVRDYDRAVRRMVRLYDFVLDSNESIRRVRRAVRAKKKKSGPPPKRIKYGVQVPRTVKEAMLFDKENNETFWQDAIKKEMQALYDLDCFEFKDSSYIPGKEYQKTRLHMIFDVKNDLRRKARLVAGGHLVDLFDTEVYSSTVKGISVKMLHVISHRNDYKALCGDVGNAFVTAQTREKVYCIAGLEFGAERQGQVVIIVKALYGLASSAACFHAHFADTLRSFGFRATRFDQDVWIKLDEKSKHYEYVCTHVDDFCIFSKNPQLTMDQIKSIFTVKSEGPPVYYLGNDYRKDRKGRWNIGCRTYIKEGIARVEKLFGTSLSKHDTPMTPGDHPELDESVLLDDDGHTKYQMLIGMLNWIVTIGRIDIAFAVASLSRFIACPRDGHLTRALYVFGYLKKKFNKRIIVDSRDPIVDKNGAEGSMDIDLTEKLSECYPDAKEEIDEKLPEPLLDELAITAYVDSDHAHDKATRRSITGLIIFVGRTPVLYMSKRQGAIETSTYGAEFIAMKTAVEEVISVRYMLRCLGVKVTKPTFILGDNRSVILNSTVPSSLLKKKHIAIAYHKTREASAAGIVHPLKTKGEWNFADVCTKAQTRKIHATLVQGMMS